MPLVKIETISGKNNDFNQKLISLVGDVLVEVFALPENDRNIRLIEYNRNNFIMKKPYEYLIEITLFKGRTKETKNTLYKKLVETIETDLKISKESIFIVLNEQPLENWGVQGGISAENIKFNFTIEK